MGRPSSSEQQELYRRIDEVLHYRWDPIGVSDVPEARDEYQSYVPQVFSLVTRGASAQEVVEFLGGVTRERMEFPDTEQSREHHRKIAAMLLRWRDVIHARHTQTPNQTMQRTAGRGAI